MPFFATTPLIGPGLDTPTTDAQFALGTRVNGTDGSTWVYVQAAGAIEQYDVVSVDEDYQATPATPTTVATGDQLAAAQVAFADDAYGWVALNGGALTLAVSAHATVNTVLYIGTVSGHLSTTASSATLSGVRITTSNATSAVANIECILTWPRCLGAGN
jgi:hypothetical protein